MIIIQVSFKTR